MIPSTLLLLAGLVTAGPVAETSSSARKAPPGLAARVWEITDVVLDHHVDPPTRPEMIALAIKRIYRAAGLPMPAGLARRLSALSCPTGLAPLLDEAWSRLPADKIAVSDTEIEPAEFLIGSMLGGLPGGARMLSAQELKVEEQFAGNRYVGLQIALGYDREANRAAITTVLKGGPADRAGVLDKDVIEEIDGTSTEGQTIPKVVERLRGAEGTRVVIRVRQPKAAEARVLTVTRGVLPKATVKGIREGTDGGKDLLLDENESIGYLKFAEILGSTPHELRVLVRRLEDEGAKALILDLRQVSQAHLHPTVLLADGLLEGGTIGRMRTAGGVETFRAEPDALFQGWPLAVLVDNDTPPTVQWLAAAIQDNHRGVIVGMEERKVVGPRGPQRGPVSRRSAEADVLSAVPVGDGSTSIEMATGRLERGDGRPIVGAEGDARGGLVPDVPVAATAPMRLVPRPAAPPGLATLPGLVENLTVFPAQPKPNTNPRAPGDPVLAAAVERLRALLKSP